MEWLRWYYLIYLLPAVIAVVVLLCGAMGAEGESDSGEAGDAGAADDGAAEEGGEDAESDADEGSSSIGRQLLGLIGFGRAPMTLVLGALMIGWGIGGAVATAVLEPSLKRPEAFVVPSLLAAAVTSLLFGRLLSGIAVRLMPKHESYAIGRGDLVGLTGKVVFPVSGELGRVHLRDRFGTLHSTSARVRAGGPELAKGTEVIVASIEADGRYVIVEPLGFTMKQS